MTEFDVSDFVFPRSNGNTNNLDDLCYWLSDNVGEWEARVRGMTADICRRGDGWEIRSRKIQSSNGYKIVSWYVVIQDERLATLFALKWMR